VAEQGERLVFEMGLYKATFPKDLMYSDIHFWFKPSGDNRTRIGLTAFAARLLADLFRIDWKVYVGENIQPEQVLGEVESTKAASELYAPMSGKLSDVNSAVVDDPSLVSLDPYDAWLLEFEGVPQHALDPQGYVAFIADGWDETVKIMKGQA
jgi:glycine cleavage system H protein